MEPLHPLSRRSGRRPILEVVAVAFPLVACSSGGQGSPSPGGTELAPEGGAMSAGSGNTNAPAPDAGGSGSSGGGSMGSSSSGSVMGSGSSSGSTGSGSSSGPSGPGSSSGSTGSGSGAPADAAVASAADAGGSSGASSTGSDGGSGCTGVAIVPDATGFVSAASNTLGIHGSWFQYSDCVDLKGMNCATVTTPTGTAFPNTGGKMCTSGKTSTATGAWGAGIGLELNDGPPQMPYDTVMHGVKGFCFQLTGTTIPTTTIRVAFPTQNNNDNAYFEAFTTSGMHSVLFADPGFAQGSWVTSKVAFEPTKVMLVQFQIPSSPTAPVPWDFCVEGMTAVTQ